MNCAIEFFYLCFMTQFFFALSHMKIDLNTTDREVHPLFASFKKRHFVLTSQGAFYLLHTNTNFFLSQAFPEFQPTFYITAATSNYFTKKLENNNTIYFFPYLRDGSSFIKKYLKSTVIEISANVPIADENSFIDTQEIENDQIVMSYIANDKSGKLLIMDINANIVLQDTANFALRSETFSCKKFNEIICFFIKENSKSVHYAKYAQGFSEENSIEDMSNETISNVKVINVGEGKGIGIIKEEKTNKILMFKFTTLDEDNNFMMSVIKKIPTDIISLSLYSFNIYNINDEYILLTAFNGDITQCIFFSFDLEELSYENKRNCGYSQFRVTFIDNFFNFVSVKDNFLYYTTHHIPRCRNNFYEISTNDTVIIDINELIDSSYDTSSEEKWLRVISKDATHLVGNYFGYDRQRKNYIEIDFTKNETEYTTIKLFPLRKGKNSFDIVTYYQIEKDFILPSPKCTVTINAICYETCGNCVWLGRESFHFCSKCRNNYFFINNTTNCYIGNVKGNFFNETQNEYFPCISNCDVCNDSKKCNQCKEGFVLKKEFTLNEKDNDCVKKCKSKWYIDKNNEFICIEKSQCPPEFLCYNKKTKECSALNASISQCEISIPYSEDINEQFKYIDINIIVLYRKKFYYEDDFRKIMIYDKKSKISQNYIELLECEDVIKKKYKEENEVIIAQIDFTDTKESFVNFYIQNGTKVKIDTCYDMTVHKFDLINEEGLTLSEEKIKKINSDLFDSNNRIFNTKCIAFNDSDKDVTLKDRRNFYFQNVTVQQELCTYIKSYYENKTTLYKCSIKSNSDNYINFGNVKQNSFSKEISEINHSVFFCFKFTFRTNLLKNIGQYIMSVLMLIQMMLIYLYNKKKKMIYLGFIRKGRDSVMKSKESSNITREDVVIYNKQISFAIKEEEKTNEIPKNLKNSIFNNKDDTFSVQNSNYEESPSLKSIFINRLRIFLPIIFICSYKNPLVVITIISPFIMTFTLNLFFNTFFYSERYISYILKNHFSLSFELDKYIISSISTIITSFFLNIFVIHFPDANSDEYQTKNQRSKFVSKINLFINIYFTAILFINFLFWYFVSAFCAIYPKTQKFLLIGTSLSFLINLLISFFTAVTCALLRVLSIKRNSKALFLFGSFNEHC